MIPLAEVNKLRSVLQGNWIKEWIAAGGRGVFVIATGVGKTHIATHHAIPRMNKKVPSYRTKVVVPKKFLKADWEGEGRKSGHIQKNKLKNVEVWVINSFIRQRHNTELLIIDEIHRTSNEDANLFKQVLDVCPAPYVLGLTATLTEEQRMFLADRNIPVIAEMTTREAEMQGLISPYRIYNLGVDLTNDDRAYERELNSNFLKYSAKFEGDMHLAMNCGSSTNPRWIEEKWMEPPAVEYARFMGWKGIPLSKAVENYRKRKHAAHGEKGKISVWEDEHDDHEFTPTRIQVYGTNYMKYMNERQDFLHNAANKLTVTKQILDKFKVPTIIFSERTKFADRITNLAGENICRSYHSKIPSRPLKKGGEFIRYGKTAAKAGQIKIFGKDTLNTRTIQEFEEGSIRILSTATSLDEGFNVEGIELAIITGGTSKDRQNTQRVGRAVRPKDGKVAVIVNLYVKRSQDENWLIRRQVEDKKALWIDSIDEITFGYDQQTIKTQDPDDSPSSTGEVEFGDEL